VPHVHLGSFVNVGVLVHARTAEFLDMRAIEDRAVLAAMAPAVDLDLLSRYLSSYRRICAGDAEAGPIALVSPSERFHWMTAPRSDVLQPSPVHEGRCADPAEELGLLYSRFVAPNA
jgi:hypothetical protein